MAQSILRDEKQLLPCAAYLTGQYGLNDIYMGVPCVLGAAGMEKVVQVHFTPDEKALMDESIRHVKDLVATVRKIFPDLG